MRDEVWEQGYEEGIEEERKRIKNIIKKLEKEYGIGRTFRKTAQSVFNEELNLGLKMKTKKYRTPKKYKTLPYNRGRAKEYRVKKKYESYGCIVLRTAGSHDLADLIAIYPKKRRIIFIQCKSRKSRKKLKNNLLKKYSWLNDEYITNFVIE